MIRNALAASIIIFAGTCQAAPSYICQVTLSPRESAKGTEGYLTIDLTTAPGCGGQSLLSQWICTAGMTDASFGLEAAQCAAQPTTHTIESLATLQNTLLQAKAWGMTIDGMLAPCRSAAVGNKCWSSVIVR